MSTSTTTTEILFNSPALRSLKREQLLKLCKIHNIKAAGKSVDLIERLKHHATTLPPDAPLNVAVRSEDDSDSMSVDECPQRPPHLYPVMPRPSEAWEVVMDNIQEVPETSSSQNTLNSLRTVSSDNAGEFGTANSKSGVGSSLRAFASSLGLKRALQSTNSEPQAVLPTTQDSLTANAIPYKSIPESSPPKHDPFVLNDRQGDNPDAPLPGNPSLPGLPAPTNARMSITIAPTNTTIRLVTTPFASTSSVVDTPPKLKPFQTSFDIVLGSPRSTAPRWPASPQNAPSIYPPIPYDLLSPANPAEKIAPQNNVVLTPHEPDVFSPLPGEKASSKLFSNTPSRPEPFLFGSPLPKNRLSNQDFGKAASSVLEEMNQRLGLTGDNKLGISLLESRGKFQVDQVPVKSTSKPDLFGFDKAHEDAFAKMDSIATHYAAKRGAKQTNTTNPQSSAKEDVVPGTKKRKSTALGVDDSRQPEKSKRVNIANAQGVNNSSKKVLPGGFGEDDEEEEDPEENRRMSKRPRVHLADPAPATELPEVALKEEEERKKQKEIEAVRRRADARRRSSRVSGVGPRKSAGRPSLANAKKNKGTTSRFGFLSSAKNLVKSVWKGAGTAEPPKPTNIPVTSSSKAVKLVASSSKPPPVVNESTSSKNSKGSFKPTNRFGFGSGSKTAATTLTTVSSVTSNSRHDSMGQRKRDSELRGVANTDGTANSRVSTVSSNGSVGTGRGTGVKRSSSTLLAPTASSLAKSRPSSSDPASKRTSLTTGTGITQQKRASLLAAREREKRISKGVASPVLASKPVLEHITNTNAKGESSGRVGGGNGASLKRIFDQPLTTDTFSSPSKIPVPAPKTHSRTTSSSSTATNKEDNVPANGKPTPTSSVSKRTANVKSRGFVPRKPRISRSQVIARLGEKRAAAATSSTTGTKTRPQPSATSKRMSADLGKGGRVRSSLGRQSYGGVNLKGRGSGGDVMLSAKKRARASEYYAKKGLRNSAVVRKSKGSGGDVEMG